MFFYTQTYVNSDQLLQILVKFWISTYLIQFILKLNTQQQMSSSDRFRRLLLEFYTKINNSGYVDIYKKILNQQFDQVQVQPIHVISLSQKPSLKKVNFGKNQKQQKKRQFLYRNNDFAAVFLFAFLLDVLKKAQLNYLKQLQQRVQNNLEIYYKDPKAEESIKYRLMFKQLFQFFNYVISKQFDVPQIQQLFKSFYNNSFERRGLKKNDRQKYMTESQSILCIILAMNNYFPSKKQISQPTSDIYEMNSLQFCINIQNMDEKQQWTIGEGENHVNIAKQKGQYYVYQQQKKSYDQGKQDNLDQNWLHILNQSNQIRKNQAQKTSKIFSNISFQCKSPTKSYEPSKSQRFRGPIANFNGKVKVGEFLI